MGRWDAKTTPINKETIKDNTENICKRYNILITLTKEELDMVNKQAEKKGLRKATYLRSLIYEKENG